MATSYQHKDNTTCRETFSRGTLELTFKVLRQRRPSLALLIQNSIAVIFPHRTSNLQSFTPELMPLSHQETQQIIHALSAIGEQMAGKYHPNKTELVLVRSLLLDWLMLSRDRFDHPCEQPAN